MSSRDVARWLQYATEDLREADRMIRQPAPVPRLACMLAQQAAEKVLKAALLFAQIDFPRTHDLDALHALLPDGWDLGQAGEELSRLTVWAVESRYPGNWPEATTGDATNAVTSAKRVLEAVERALARHGWTGHPGSGVAR